MQVIAERWEEGDTEAVGGIACHLQNIDVSGLPIVMFEVLRGASGPYRPFGTVDDLSPYWRDWCPARQCAGSLAQKPGSDGTTAQTTATKIQTVIHAYLDRHHRMDHRTSQPILLHEALRLAVSVDEMDMSLQEGLQDAGDLESVHRTTRCGMCYHAKDLNAPGECRWS